MASKTYRVGVIGCRSRGRSIARGYHAHRRAEVVAVCDLNAELRDALGDELGVAARFDDLDEMIDKARPDIVIIATGTEFHYPLAMRVLAHGVHIDIEKPMCVSLDEADRMVALAREKGVEIAVHHQTRTSPVTQAMRQAIDDGRIGALRHFTLSEKGYYGGLGLMNIGVHMINNLLELAGPVARVIASGLTDGRPITPEDVIEAPLGMGPIAGEHITATLEFARQGNCCATLLLHRLYPMSTAGYTLEVLGQGGRMFWGRSRKTDERATWLTSDPHPAMDASDQWQRLEERWPEGLARDANVSVDEYVFADDFVTALDAGRSPRASGVEGVHTMEVMMGIFESAAYGRAVALPQAQRDHPLLRWRAEAGLGPPASSERNRERWLEAEDRRLGRAPAAHPDPHAYT